MPQEVSVVMDDREMRSGIMDVFRGVEGVSIRVQRLALGDYVVDSRLLVERKTLHDLTVSIKDGRLFRQALQLAEAPLQSLIILEGTVGSLKGRGMSRESLQGALITLTVFFGIPLLRSRDPEETVRLMIYAARQGRVYATEGLPRKGKRPRGKLRTQLHILQGLPGVGPERARLLLEAFGSVEAVLTASEEALRSVDGIGTTTVERICWAIREPESVYDVTGRSSVGSGHHVPSLFIPCTRDMLEDLGTADLQSYQDFSSVAAAGYFWGTPITGPFPFQAGEESLYRGIVPTVAFTAHAADYSMLLQ
jgi:ERCC4-type nuclease